MSPSVVENEHQHSFLEDLFGVISGSVLLALGIALLHVSGVVTGGTAGIALIFAKKTHMEVGTLYLLIGIPFLLLALWKKGWQFALRSVVTLAFVSYLVNVMPRIVTLHAQNQWLVAIGANLMAGVGMVVIFRHYTSLGGFNVVAILAQEKLHWKAGHVQLAFDFAVILSSLSVYSLKVVIISLVGDGLLNLSLTLNYRSDRYVGYSLKN